MSPALSYPNFTPKHNILYLILRCAFMHKTLQNFNEIDMPGNALPVRSEKLTVDEVPSNQYTSTPILEETSSAGGE